MKIFFSYLTLVALVVVSCKSFAQISDEALKSSGVQIISYDLDKPNFLLTSQIATVYPRAEAVLQISGPDGKVIKRQYTFFPKGLVLPKNLRSLAEINKSGTPNRFFMGMSQQEALWASNDFTGFTTCSRRHIRNNFANRHCHGTWGANISAGVEGLTGSKPAGIAAELLTWITNEYGLNKNPSLGDISVNYSHEASDRIAFKITTFGDIAQLESTPFVGVTLKLGGPRKWKKNSNAGVQ